MTSASECQGLTCLESNIPLKHLCELSKHLPLSKTRFKKKNFNSQNALKWKRCYTMITDGKSKVFNIHGQFYSYLLYANMCVPVNVIFIQ